MDQIIGSSIVRLQQTDSTNNYANRQIRENTIPEGTVFLAYDQTSGKGQMTNTWESEPGKNLTLSIVIYPDFLEIPRQFELSKVITLGIYKALYKYVDQLKIKWPNDVYAGNRKLGGILIENSIMNGLLKSSVAGIGLNVNQTVFLSNAPNPVSMRTLTNQHYNCVDILTEVLSEINVYYNLLKIGALQRIDDEFMAVMYRYKENHSFKSGEEVFEGEIIGVNDIGQLLIQKADGKILEFFFKEVEFLQNDH